MYNVATIDFLLLEIFTEDNVHPNRRTLQHLWLRVL